MANVLDLSKVARFEPKSALEMALFKPKYLAQFDRKGWHKSNRYIQLIDELRKHIDRFNRTNLELKLIFRYTYSI